MERQTAKVGGVPGDSDPSRRGRLKAHCHGSGRGGDIIKSKKVPLIGAPLLFGVFTSKAAEPAGEAGGLPSLGARVGVLEITVERQGTAGAELQLTVGDLQS